ncbi:MAG: tyrosine--tRNA ligase [Actinobacteria bacterium]|nr:tyrosine--tRNA ligase [Actinomycetota bacterium]MCL6104206.1 tyrosine--tRNA ligase [Actinomycetota bacterium]
MVFEDLEYRGLVYQFSDPLLKKLLDLEQLVVYAGFDPTSDSLHVGHLLQICNLRRLAEKGHKPIVVLGGATGMIGDPSGKTEERPLMEPELLNHNIKSLQVQFERLLGEKYPVKGGNSPIIVNNLDWMNDLGLLDFLRDIGKHFGIGQMIAKESVRSRIGEHAVGISFTEFSYMLLQAYDFLHLYDTFGCRLQIGASDQWGNITMGIELIANMRKATVFGLTSPLIVKSDGTKFGKTESGTIWLDEKKTSPYRLYQFFYNASDTEVATWLRYFTDLSHQDLSELDNEVTTAPADRVAQRELARQVTTMVHNKQAADRAEFASKALFGGELSLLDEKTLLDVFSDVPSVVFPRTNLGEMTLVDMMVESNIAPSRGSARRTIDQGGVYLNNLPVRDTELRIDTSRLLCDAYLVLKKGKREIRLLRFA